MKFYLYNEEGYLTSTLETNDESYLVPENSTQIEPPVLKQNQTCRFDGMKWIVEEMPVQATEPAMPTMEEYLIDLDFRVSMIELGL